MKVCLACDARFSAAGWRCPACGYAPAKSRFRIFAPTLAARDEGFGADVVGRLAEIEPRSFWFVNRNRVLAWALREYFPDARKFLEVGCGTGFVMAGLRESFPELALSGTDASIAALEVAASRVPDTELLQVDARRLPFDQEFDVLGSFDVIEHVEEDEQVLAQIFGALAPGGGVLIAVPQHPWLWSGADESAHHKRRYGRSEMIAKVTRAGFELVRTTSFVSLLLPGMALARMRRAGRAADCWERELMPGKGLGWLLERTLAVELALIRGGLSFPAGGSLLVVARRPGNGPS